MVLTNDESYNLSVPTLGKSAYARIEAATVCGALHGLFPYRGLLIDTSRHSPTASHQEYHRLNDLRKAECFALARCRLPVFPLGDTFIPKASVWCILYIRAIHNF